MTDVLARLISNEAKGYTYTSHVFVAASTTLKDISDLPREHFRMATHDSFGILGKPIFVVIILTKVETESCSTMEG